MDEIRKPESLLARRSPLDEVSIASTLIEVPMSLEAKAKPHYQQAIIVYKIFLSACTDKILYNMDTKFELLINHLVSASLHLNIWVSKISIVNSTLHYLLHLLDKSTHQTLCVIAMSHKKKNPRCRKQSKIVNST